MFKKTVSLLLFTVFLIQTSGCYSWRGRPAEEYTPQQVEDQETIILELDSGGTVQLLSPLLNEAEGTITGVAVGIDGVRQDPMRPMEIRLEEIRKISIQEFDGTKTVLWAVGGTAMAFAALVLIVALTKESCPFVYTEEEEGFKLRGELYSGAVFPEVERTDVLRLGSLTPRDGRVRLRLANEVLETQYTDELTLLVVDHPKGTRVAPGPDGVIHTLSSPVRPISAEESRGGSVLEAVLSDDDEVWLPEPFHRELENPSELRDQLKLSFPRPAGATEAKLQVKIRNTYWADHAFGSFLGLLGSQMKTWYASEGQKMSPGRWGRDFMAEHGMSLTVENRGSDGWDDIGFFFPTGPIGWQEEVLTLPLNQEPSETLDLRLTGGGMFWMVDQVAVDYEMDVPIVIHEVTPEKAIDQEGVDVTGLLLARDDAYYVMPQPGHFAEITYQVPPETPGMDRTYLVRSEGYYIIHQKQTGPPDWVRLAEIQSNPDGFLRFSMERFWEVSGYAPPEVSRFPN